jgi:CDP-glycerol glycerophosphotransferase (TagB/SpsB family)
MPTWRKYLKGFSETEFKSSEYYQRFTSLLCNKSLHCLLDQYDYDLVFYPHYEIQRYIHLFSSNHPRVVIAGFANYDVQELLLESSLLLTDYSSVFFDFAYMKKPVIYYQFDYDTFRRRHYNEGYFDYYTMGFGDVKTTEDELLSAIRNVLEAGCVMDEKYKRISDDFFKLNDTHNCERIYHCILDLV